MCNYVRTMNEINQNEMKYMQEYSYICNEVLISVINLNNIIKKTFLMIASL